MFRRSCFYLTTLLYFGLLLACTGTVEKWNPDDYTVKSGDTVYSIAWRYELDPEEFAAWNKLGSSKIIKPGQRLHTRKPKNFVASREVDNESPGKVAYAPSRTDRHKSDIPEWVTIAKDDTLYSISRRYDVSVEQLVQFNRLKDASMIQPGQRIYLKPNSATTTASTAKSKSASKPGVPRSTQARQQGSQSPTFSWPKKVRWQRPAEGKVVKKFNRRRNDAKGIDIAGKLGDRIVASADGKVVYSGDGLISYGKLIIIKHNDTYLSAYAYNRKLLVNEGDFVTSGQKIAEMGRKDSSKPQLHFEIRKNGKPVDPLKYLPW